MTHTQPDGFLAVPETGTGPGVLVLHAWWGLNETIKVVCAENERLGSDNCAALSAAATWRGVKLTASRLRQSPLVMIAEIERMLPERFVHRNAAKRHSLIFFLFVVIMIGRAASACFSRPAATAGLSSPASCFINHRGRAPVGGLGWFSCGPVWAEEPAGLPQAEAEEPVGPPQAANKEERSQPPFSAGHTRNHPKL